MVSKHYQRQSGDMNAKRAESQRRSVLEWSGILRRRSLGVFGLLLLVLASALGVVHSSHRNAAAFNELQMLKEEALRLDVDWGRLLIEQSTFGVDGRIERKAREELNMRVPQPEEMVIVQQAAVSAAAEDDADDNAEDDADSADNDTDDTIGVTP